MTNEGLRLYQTSGGDGYYIFHYNQPHAPFINCPGKYDSIKTVGLHGATQNVWKGLRDKKYDRDELWEDYCRSLYETLDEVQKVVDNVSGRVVISSDHGNLLGEFGLYGHPSHVPVSKLKRVPWVTTSGKGLDNYTPTEIDKTRNTERKEYLENLGYL